MSFAEWPAAIPFESDRVDHSDDEAARCWSHELDTFDPRLASIGCRMPLTVVLWISIAVALIGCCASLASTLAVRRFRRVACIEAKAPTASVTILKPLHGAEPDLYENLSSFVDQDYAGTVQIVFGVCGTADSAMPIVQRLIDEHPQRDLELVVSRQALHGNGKIANLIGMKKAIRHDCLVLSDSDMRVGPDYLKRVVAALDDPDVGLVTYLYRGEANQGLWAVLSSMAIDFHFFPQVLLGLRLKKAHPCMGATMAFRRETLAEIGGFEAFATCLADDYAIGAAIRSSGRRVAVGSDVVVHRCTEAGVADLFFHELRWARTLRSIDPLGFAGSVVTNPLPFALVAVFCATLVGGAGPYGLATLLFTVCCRLLLQWQIERALGISTGRWVLGPARDVFSFVVFCASYLVNDVVWRGHRYRVATDGTMEKLVGSRS